MKAHFSEIFSSIQGEGPYVGERQLFVRFAGCHRNCIYCDTETERTQSVLVEKSAGSGELESVPNPLSVEQLVELIHTVDAKKNNRHISLTGGEPLLHVDFLSSLLPALNSEDGIYLETAGDMPHALKAIAEWIDVVSMDVKLESVTQEPHTFPAHWQFLKLCRDWDIEVFVKLVLSAETDEKELKEAAQGILKAGGMQTLVVIQPMTKAEKTDAVPTAEQLFRWQEMVGELLPNVRVIPQTHLMMEML